ncbi:condensation domain-containing protein [Nocardia sp. NBC_01499]
MTDSLKRRSAPRGKLIGIPLTAAQLGVWLAQQLVSGSAVFNIAEYMDISGPLQLDALVTSIRSAVAEVPALNVRFREDEDGPRQYTAPLDWDVEVVDLADDADPLGTALAAMADEVEQPRDLLTGTLFAHIVFRLSESRTLWYHRVHHILLDGYGMALLAHRVADRYTAAVASVAPAPVAFGSWYEVMEADAEYSGSAEQASDRAFWMDYYRGRPAPVALSGTAGSAIPARGLRESARIPTDLGVLLRRTAEAARTTWTDVFYAAVAAYVHRITGVDEVCLALPVMLRTGTPALRVPCMTLNGIPMWTDLSGAPALTDLAQQVARHLVRSRRHHRYRAEHIRRDLGLVGSDRRMYGPSVNIMLFDYDLRLADCTSTAHNVAAGMLDDIVFNIYDRGDGTDALLCLDGHPDSCTAAELATHLQRFLGFLRTALERPHKPVWDAELFLPGERALLLAAGRGAENIWPHETIAEIFAERIRQTPHAPALTATTIDRRQVTLTFAEIGTHTAALSGLLQSTGVRPGSVVAVLLPRTVEAVSVVFAILDCGATYVPLEATQPAERIALLLDGLDERAAVVTVRADALDTEALARQPDGLGRH